MLIGPFCQETSAVTGNYENCKRGSSEGIKRKTRCCKHCCGKEQGRPVIRSTFEELQMAPPESSQALPGDGEVHAEKLFDEKG